MIFSKVSGLNNSVFGKSEDPIKRFMVKEDQVYQASSKIEELFCIDHIDTYAAKYGGMTSKGNFEVVPEGGARPRTKLQEGYSKTVEPFEFASSFEVTKQMIEDDKMNLVRGLAADFVQSYHRTREEFAAKLFMNATSTTMDFGGYTFNIACQDGLAWASASHTSKTGGTGVQSNYGTLTLTEDNLLLVEEYMQKFTDDDGHLLNIQPDTLIIPNVASMKKAAAQILFTESGMPGTTDNSFNMNKGRFNLVIWNVFNKASTATDHPWVLLDSRYVKNFAALVWVERIDLEVENWIDNNTKNAVWDGRARFGLGVPNWRCAYHNIPA